MPDLARPRLQAGTPRAGHPCRTRQKIENSLLNSLFSGNLPACMPGRVAIGRRIEPRTLSRRCGDKERVPMKWDHFSGAMPVPVALQVAPLSPDFAKVRRRRA
jgi:hypothetical protein